MKKQYITLSVLTIFSLIACLVSAILLETLNIWLPFAISLTVCFILITILFIFYFKNVKFQCPNCKSIFKSKKSEILWAMHTPTKRRITCPNCKQKKWCKDIFDK